MTESRELVSVVIPAYNAARYVVAAVESALTQTYPEVEVIVVDDGSTDLTPEVLRAFENRIQLVCIENSGVSRARNKGIELAGGSYVAFLDADDVWMPRKLEAQIEAIKGAQAAGGAFSCFAVAGNDLAVQTYVRYAPKSDLLTALLCRGNVVGTPSSVIVERKLLGETGGFDPQLSQCADWDLWMRLAMRAELQYVDEPLVTYRKHGQSMSRDIELLEADSVATLDKAFRSPVLPPVALKLEGRARGKNYMVLAGSYYEVANYPAAARCAIRSLRHDPTQIGYLAGFPRRRLSKARA